MERKSEPLVSICLLTYNRAAVLAPSLDSLLAQTYQNFELIINDDRSTDDTERICRSFERLDSRVKYFKNDRNVRYAGNQNLAIQRASAEYVAIVHDGDVYRPDIIARWVAALVKYPSAAIVFNALQETDEAGNDTRILRYPYGEFVPGRDLLGAMLLSASSPIYGIVMVKRSCCLSVGEFDLTLPTLADVDMWMRLLAKFDAAYLDMPLIRVGRREKNHHNRIGNWKVKAEHERIYQLNLDRNRGSAVYGSFSYRLKVAGMLWRQRLLWLAWCGKHAEFQKLFAGLAFSCSNPIARQEIRRILTALW